MNFEEIFYVINLPFTAANRGYSNFMGPIFWVPLFCTIFRSWNYKIREKYCVLVYKSKGPNFGVLKSQNNQKHFVMIVQFQNR